MYVNNPTEIRQIAVTLNICVLQQLNIFVSNSHQLLAKHEDEMKAR